MTSTDELQHWMRFMHGFAGVFARDETPHLFDGQSMIVNTDTSNLGGTHWIAIVLNGRQRRYFDPFGGIPIRNIARKYHINIISMASIQDPNRLNCGQHCVFFIYNGYPACNDTQAVNFCNTLL